MLMPLPASSSAAAPSLFIRRFEPADAPALRGVFCSAVREVACRDYSPGQLDAWAPADHEPAVWARLMARLDPFVAVLAGEPVGYADVQASGLIDHFFVAARANGRGVARALMARVEAEARGRGITELHAEVSLTAEGFFARMGFEVVRRQVVTVRGVALRNAVMRRCL
ncbi:GNAT family N-acetyltransferase [Derxia gummosa]|uniref:GNAT family N-acetyltransferase n=1 Tax=Derxia gummosa DSM 723 TaxID=1121388 RepID=A0A9U5FV96_9BURK|nr:GNAT family N-acetyltransferase [Derxia gummosa]